MKKNILIIIGIFVVILIISIFVLYFDKKQSQSLDLENGSQNTADKTDDIDALKNNNQAVMDSASRMAASQAREIDSSDHYLGELAAPVQLIVYGDFDDPFSAQYTGALREVKEYFNDQIVIAFRHFPLRGNADAIAAALAGECAAEQDMFWQMHDKLFAASLEDGLNEDRMKADAGTLDLDVDEFNACLDSQKYLVKIQEQLDEARSAGVFGAPSSFINGEPIPGAYPFEDFTDSQEREREGLKSIIEGYLNK